MTNIFTTVNDEGELSKQLYVEDGLSHLVELHVSCEELADLDITSHSDPLAVLWSRESSTAAWQEVGRTEYIANNLNPNFVTVLSLRFFFEQKQALKIEIYDVDSPTTLPNLRNQQLIGSSEFFLHQLMGAPQRTLKLPLIHEKRAKCGRVILLAEQLRKRLSSDLVKFTVEGLNINRKALLFFRVYRCGDSNETEFLPVYQSEGAKAMGNTYHWKAVSAGAAGLLRDDPHKPLKIELFEYKTNGDHRHLGLQRFQFADLIDRTLRWEGTFGTVLLKNAELIRRASFLDYLFGGINIALTVAIDFTGSNGNPTDRTSLHYFDLNTNQYIRAISEVGSILQEYDLDKNIPVFGFGAVLPGLDVSHCFALNGDIFGPELHTIQGVIEAYRLNLRKLSFAGPTNFASIIRYVGDAADYNVRHGIAYGYNVLLIITDGQITDMDETVDEIVRCSGLPVSIIIVGVGNGDFSQMDQLDADTKPLFSRRLNRTMYRDIVQFVPYSQYRAKPQDLAKQTLAELPKQLVDYMTHMKLPPLAQAVLPLNPQPSFYEARKQAFLSSLPPGFPHENASKLLQVGFPVEDHNLFIQALARGYVNSLHL